MLLPRPKVAAEAIDDVMKKLENTVPTSAPVDEGGFIQKDGTYTPERQALASADPGKHLYAGSSQGSDTSTR